MKNNQRKSQASGKGGKRPGAGRKKGTPNKLTADVKAAIMEAFNQVGGAEYLRQVAKSDPRTICTLLGKVLPAQVADDPNNPLQTINRIELVVVDPKHDRLPPSRRAQGLISGIVNVDPDD